MILTEPGRRMNSAKTSGRLVTIHPDRAWEGAVMDDSSPGSPRGLKCGRATGRHQIIL
jgi:hypothetical protein